MKNLSLIILIVVNSYYGFAQKAERIIIEDDIVKSTKRIKLQINYSLYDACEKKSPLLSMKQIILKEVDVTNNPEYNVYEYMAMEFSSYGLKPEMYIITNDTNVLSIELTGFMNEIKPETHKSTSNIMKADSSNVEVITGYTHYDKKTYKLHYKLTQEQIDQIKKSQKVQFRYYSGPDMITLQLKGLQLQKLKKMIETT